MKKLLALVPVAATLLLVACQDAPQTPSYPPLSFTNQAPYQFNVAQVQVQDSNAVQPGSVDGNMPITIKQSVQQWATDRLKAVGGAGMLVVNIDDASVREVKLPKTDGIKGWFTDDQDARYDAVISVTLRLYSASDNTPVATATATVNRSRSIHEKATVDERNQFYYELVRDLMTQFNTEADTRIRQFFPNYLRY